MKRGIIVGGVCFLLGAIPFAFGATAIRPEQFVALAWSWTATQTFDGVHKITGLPTPSSSSDAAPKSYVDSAVSSGSIAVGGTPVSSGTNGRVLYDNAGTLGELVTTGSGNAVLATSPSIGGLTVTGSFTATGLVTNGDLANAATTVNGQTCTLGSTCTITAAATGIIVGSTTISGGTTGRILYDNAGSLGELSDTNIAYTDAAQTWTATQSSTPQTLTISTSTFTPAVASGNNIKITLVHASCPCTFANWSGTPIAGTSGVLEVIQSATGSDTIGTWGSQYVAAGGTTTLTLSTAANAIDFFSYYVIDATHTLITSAALNATH